MVGTPARVTAERREAGWALEVRLVELRKEYSMLNMPVSSDTPSAWNAPIVRVVYSIFPDASATIAVMFAPFSGFRIKTDSPHNGEGTVVSFQNCVERPTTKSESLWESSGASERVIEVVVEETHTLTLRHAPIFPAVWLNQRAVPLYLVAVGMARWEALAGEALAREALAGEGRGETGKVASDTLCAR